MVKGVVQLLESGSSGKNIEEKADRRRFGRVAWCGKVGQESIGPCGKGRGRDSGGRQWDSVPGW